MAPQRRQQRSQQRPQQRQQQRSQQQRPPKQRAQRQRRHTEADMDYGAIKDDLDKLKSGSGNQLKFSDDSTYKVWLVKHRNNKRPFRVVRKHGPFVCPKEYGKACILCEELEVREDQGDDEFIKQNYVRGKGIFTVIEDDDLEKIDPSCIKRMELPSQATTKILNYMYKGKVDISDPACALPVNIETVGKGMYRKYEVEIIHTDEENIRQFLTRDMVKSIPDLEKVKVAPPASNHELQKCIQVGDPWDAWKILSKEQDSGKKSDTEFSAGDPIDENENEEWFDDNSTEDSNFEDPIEGDPIDEYEDDGNIGEYFDDNLLEDDGDGNYYEDDGYVDESEPEPEPPRQRRRRSNGHGKARQSVKPQGQQRRPVRQGDSDTNQRPRNRRPPQGQQRRRRQ